MKALSVVLMIVFVCDINALYTRVCGPHLTQLLEAVCVNGYNGMQMAKKSTYKPLTSDIDAIDIYNEIDDDISPFKSNSLLKDMLYGERINTLAKTRRQRHLSGVYDECCRKPCNMDELLSYCL
ncbi:probable insulin-like peptide 3 [Musca vetustissima]|uniref:probable insulin-like peptide 3 n=1 Tax=Musca vetustissima TaxID=27455 RepID=UPI002AB6ED1E|nr:probable insulin-like peptide 3 [Musca vetustissima]